MILKKIYLENIRSYKNQEIEFPKGSTLLAGDIGSGKTSILLGIEFGLFGLQPGQRGNSLLRNEAKEGKVILEFEVDELNVVIERTLKRGKTISQDSCSIKINGEKYEFAVTELKNKILEILSYPKEFSKKQNLLYRFTVYTPQEEMKQIILQDAETRVNTLRHVFGIDKYKKIIENSSIIASKIREEKRIKEVLTANLEQDRFNLIQKEEELESKYFNLQSIEKELFFKTEQRKKIMEEKDEIASKIEEKNKLQQEIEKTKIMYSNKKESIGNNLRIIQQLQEQIEQFKQMKFNDNELLDLQKAVQSFKKQRQELNEKIINISGQIHSFDVKNAENETLKTQLTHIDICPTCLQDVNPNYRANVLIKLNSEISQNKREIEKLNIDKKEINDKMKKIEEEISHAENKMQELNILKVKIQGAQEKEMRIDDFRKQNISLQKDISLLENHMEILRKNIFDLNRFEKIFEEKNKELDNALREEKFAEIKVAELKKEIDLFSKQIEEMGEKIKKSEEIKEKLIYLSFMEDWLIKKFVPLIYYIEKSVMTKLNLEFSKLFAEWFSMLVSDNFNIRLDDDFTPIIEQQDYEIDYAYLSGGERTAVALAYRLALNQVINSLLSKIKTKDLVILDEPTDGFSEQQLDKIRDVLQQLNVSQLIIVSHEQKIESFVENVIRFRKDGGVSRKV